MKSKIKAMLEDERGVSPVIGVILMVAITVILAAVIGTFVLGLGDSLNQAPQAQLDASSSSADTLEISHNGGDALTVSDVKISIGSNSDLALNSDSDSSFTGTSFTVGDSATFTTTSVGSDISGDPVEVTIIHTPSESILFQQEITIG